VENRGNGKVIYCEALQIDDNFRNEYNQLPRTSIPSTMPVAVMNAWYRHRLGDLETKKDHDLAITVSQTLCAKLRACFDHPQTIVRVAVWLACLSVGLGLLGVLMSLS
jgi:hypothetical protein